VVVNGYIGIDQGRKTKRKSLLAQLKKTRIDRSLLFIILMSPVIKAARNEIPMETFDIKIRANGPGSPPNLVKTANNMESRMKATARPTDHLPKELFGRILIRMAFTSCDI
jgi:hypothetical protein